MVCKEYIMNFIEGEIKSHGGLRKLADDVGLDPAIICKMRKGAYVPSEKTLRKWFGIEPDDSIVELPEDTGVTIFCDDLRKLKELLDKLGYEIIIHKKS